MQRKFRPAVDPMVKSREGKTRDGQPMSYNRSPAADLVPWLARFHVSSMSMPDGHVLSCGLLNEAATVRIFLSGEWTVHTADGPALLRNGAFYFGPNSRHMPVTVSGSFVSVGFALRPGTGTALKLPHVGDYVDRVVPTDVLNAPSADFVAAIDPAAPPEQWLQGIEEVTRRQVKDRGGGRPDPVTAAFEAISFSNPGLSIKEAAAGCGVDRRKLERVISRDFGMPPKQVLRRARALDMASYLRGVADAAEGEEMALRYYDESHLIHEFTNLFGISPRQFIARPQPILTLSLEARQARRLEMLNRLTPGGIRPWE
ncbi:helix-turn-helix domain-containing protein [Novosphingobium panipatense]|uniref:Transcriptional regulator, AraC family n=2 Tax=Novosphingobium panipatense TaxID=428991 RepID=A0ABY1QF81_9SPHN|nr:helix-turn-helix domain-containing protein [Novosphingobium panipatense]SMP69232.1 transcriptional regulator, AraC family [Novosphingobium panipatense]